MGNQKLKDTHAHLRKKTKKYIYTSYYQCSIYNLLKKWIINTESIKVKCIFQGIHAKTGLTLGYKNKTWLHKKKIPYCNLNCPTVANALPLADICEHYTRYHKTSVLKKVISPDVTDFAGKKSKRTTKKTCPFLCFS